MGRAGAYDPRALHERADAATEFGRIVGFTDGVFAIAITLLVLNLDVPDTTSDALWDALADDWGQYLAYVLSFAVIGRFWIVHHRFFATLHGFNGRLIVANLVYLSVVVLIPFPTELLGEYGEGRDATVIYAATMAAVALVNWLMIQDAFRSGLVRQDAALRGLPSLMIAAFFLVSIPVAFLSPTAAKVIWAATFPARRLLR